MISGLSTTDLNCVHGVDLNRGYPQDFRKKATIFGLDLLDTTGTLFNATTPAGGAVGLWPLNYLKFSLQDLESPDRQPHELHETYVPVNETTSNNPLRRSPTVVECTHI